MHSGAVSPTGCQLANVTLPQKGAWQQLGPVPYAMQRKKITLSSQQVRVC